MTFGFFRVTITAVPSTATATRTGVANPAKQATAKTAKITGAAKRVKKPGRVG
jgi:hypothetical protein